MDTSVVGGLARSDPGRVDGRMIDAGYQYAKSNKIIGTIVIIYQLRRNFHLFAQETACNRFCTAAYSDHALQSASRDFEQRGRAGHRTWRRIGAGPAEFRIVPPSHTHTESLKAATAAFVFGPLLLPPGAAATMPG